MFTKLLYCEQNFICEHLNYSQPQIIILIRQQNAANFFTLPFNAIYVLNMCNIRRRHF